MPKHSHGIGTPYWYEWEIGLLKCLDMMTDMSISSVVLQSADFKSLDDVVINYTEGFSCNIQVKHTDVDNNFSYGTLNTGDSPMLKKWANEWKTCKDSFRIAEIHIVTNKKWGPNKTNGRCSFVDFVNIVLPKLKLDYNYSGNNTGEQNAIKWFKEQLAFLEMDAAEFTRLLFFEQAGEYNEVEKTIEQRIIQLFGTSDEIAISIAKKSLLAQLSVWSTSRRDKQEIYREDVYSVLCADSRVLPKYELYPEKPIFPSRKRFAVSFTQLLRETKKRIVFLEGMPGSGKTNFVSYLAQLDDSPVDFRFYTYLPVNKQYPSYSDDEGYYKGELLWLSLLTQLKKGFEELGKLCDVKFPLIYSSLSVSEMRNTVLEYLPLYAGLIEHTCYIFIDGLDHAARSKDVRNSLLYQLPRPDEVGEQVKFVFVSQPANENFPIWIKNNSEIEYVSLPLLEQDDVALLLNNEPIKIPKIDITSLAQSITLVVGNNALNVLFAIQEIKANCAFASFEEIIKYLKQRKLNEQISSYYEWIVNSLEKTAVIQKLQFVFAFSSQKITLEQLALLCGKPNDYMAYTLEKLYPLIIQDDGNYYAFHNDVRLFFKRTVIAGGNYKTLAVAMKEIIQANTLLRQFTYDIVFESLCEMDNIEHLLSVFTPEYIIKSVQYSFPLDRLLSQFGAVSNILVNNGDLDSLNNMSLVASALNQFLSCVHYYEKENEYYENKFVSEKTRSEKYILNTREDLFTIVKDIYSLLVNQQERRALDVYKEYLVNCEFTAYLSLEEEGKNSDEISIYEQCGYICRYFNPSILSQQSCNNENYLKFIDGWLKASVGFTHQEELENTFSFKSYHSNALLEYVVGICQQDTVSNETLEKISHYLISDSSVSITILIELCIKMILSNYNSKELRESINCRYNELLTDNVTGILIYNSEKILWYFKAYFCIYLELENKQSVFELYESILQQCHIGTNDRGYAPALKQLDCAQRIIESYYSGNCDNQLQIDDIYSLVYISNKYGVGSCHDCESYAVRRFLLMIVYETYIKENDLVKIAKLCEGILSIYTAVDFHPRYVRELAPLFYVAKEKDKYLEIVQCWAGPDGLMWKNEYDDVEYYYNSIADILEAFQLNDIKQAIELRKKYRIISYPGHKDYSLNDLLEWYKILPNNKQKLVNWGMQLLAISDSVHEIGDNRMANSIDQELFLTAVELGPMFVDGLFELKNTPDDFYYWRECLLNIYHKKIFRLHLNDSELFSLYRIVNSWINLEIEKKRRYGYNKIEYLQHFNSDILALISDKTTRSIIVKNGNCTYEKDDQDIKRTQNDQFGWILDLVNEKGYNQEVKQKICSTFSADDHGMLNILVDVGGKIENELLMDYVHECVVEYILINYKYSLHTSGLERLIEKYYMYFSEDDWKRIVLYVLSKYSIGDESGLCYISQDLEVLDRYYNIKNHTDQLERIVSSKLDMHWSLITACGLINRKVYNLSLVSKVDSIEDFANKHLGVYTIID